MRTRVWNELAQIKYNEFYCIYLLARQKRILNYFNIITLIFSTAGIMGWSIWNSLPFVVCVIISFIQLLRLLQTHIIPSDKEIEKLDKVSDFYFEYFNKIEALWYSQARLSEIEIQDRYYEIKETEKDANKILKDVIKRINNGIDKKAKSETLIFLKTNFNL
jgi:hypothetical protein